MLYDVFLSHNYADKNWTRAIFESMSTTEYDGRKLRVWLDETVLDPGNPSSARELESALDRSHRLALVLSPEALASPWVQHELEYFTRIAALDRVIVLKRRACDVPPAVAGCTSIDWPGGPADGAQRAALLELLRPRTDNLRCYLHRRAVRRAFGNARLDLGNGFDPRPTLAGEALLTLLLKPQLENLDEEGLALVGFDAAGQVLAELDDGEGHMMRLVLGEILAEAQLRDPRYAQVAVEYVQRDVRLETRPSLSTFRARALNGKLVPVSTTHLLFTIARAASKLAEIDSARVDLSTIAAVLQRLDGRSAFDRTAQSVAMMVGRALGKLRGTPLVDALLHALSNWGSDASHIAVAAAVSCAFDERDKPVYTTDEMQRRAAQAGPTAAVARPGRRIACLLMEPFKTRCPSVNIERDIRNARDDYVRAFGPWEPGGEIWPDLHGSPPVIRLHGGPLVGIARLITRANMETWSNRLGPSDIACLTEPRIVDALFDCVGGFLIDEQQADAPLGVRLRARGARFATCSVETMACVSDGAALIWWPRGAGQIEGYCVAAR